MNAIQFLIKQARLSGGLFHRWDDQKEALVVRWVAGINEHGKFGHRISTV
jgi:hypothetical protein